MADQILGLCFCLLPLQPGVWMSFSCSLVKVGIRHDGLGTFFHGFPPDLLWCFSVSEPCDIRYLKVLKSSSSTHPVLIAVTHICRLVLEAMVLDMFFDCESGIWEDFVGAFSAFLTFWRVAPFSKDLPQPHGPNVPKRPSNHFTSAAPCACAVQMPRFQPFRPSARARLEAIKDKTLSPVKATLEEAPRDSDPAHSAD